MLDTSTPNPELRRSLYTAALMALYLPPFAGGTLMGIAGYYPMPQFYAIFISYTGLYVLGVSILVLALTDRAIRFFAHLSVLEPQARAGQVAQAMRGMLSWTLLGVLLYSIGGAISANFSLVQLGVRGEFTLAEHVSTIVGIIPVVLITAFPIFFYLTDFLGRHFASSGVVEVAAPLSTKLFVLGLFTPVLIDTLLIAYFYNRIGTLPSEVVLLWLGLIGLAAAGTWVAWRSINQSLEPLREYIGSAGSPASTMVRLIPRSLDELGLLTDKLRQRLEAEQRVNAIVEAAPDLVALADPQGRLTYVNAGGRRMLGLAPDFDVTTTCIPDYHDAATAARILHEVLPICMAQGYWEGESVFRRSDGSSFTAGQVVMAHRDPDGKVVSVSTIARDLTEHQHAEQKLRAALHEKEVLLKEVYHRVKNNLQVVASLLNMQARGVSDAVTKVLLLESANRVKSMALVHEQLYQGGDLSSIDFAAYLRQLAKHLRDVYGEVATRAPVRIEAEPTVLGIETAVPLGLIINELVANAYKHAFPGTRRGQVLLRLRALGGGLLELVVSDDGVGLPAGFQPGRIGSLGMQLVASLAEQLAGTLECGPERRGGDAGSRFALRFTPEQAESQRLVPVDTGPDR